MTEPNEAMKAMARRIVTKVCAEQRVGDGGWVPAYMFDAALAAIIETTELAAKLVENWNRHPATGLPHETSANIAERIERGDHLLRTGNHYGKDESNG